MSESGYQSLNAHTAVAVSAPQPSSLVRVAAGSGGGRRSRKGRVRLSAVSAAAAAAAVSPRFDASKPAADALKVSTPPSAVAHSATAPTSTSASASSASAMCGCLPARRSPMANALHLSCSFCLVFLAFSVAQNSQTSLNPEVGAIGLGILYTVFTLSNTFSAFLVSALTVRLALFLGALCYALYVAANIATVPPLLYASSAVIGLGAAVLWTAQGGFIAACAGQHEEENALPAHSTMGQFNGIFFSIFQVNQFVGNLLAALQYTYQASQSSVFAVMTVICGCGVATLLLLPNTHAAGSRADLSERADMLRHAASAARVEDDEDGDEDERRAAAAGADLDADAYTATDAAPRQSVSVSAVLSSLRLLSDGRLSLMLMLIIYSGFAQSWMYGAFPPLVLGNERRFFVLAFMGGADAFFSYTLGKLSDRVGRLPILLLGLLTHSAVYVYVASPLCAELATNTEAGSGPVGAVYLTLPLPYMFVLALLLAVGDACWNTQTYAILGSYFPSRANQAFASRSAHSHTHARAAAVPSSRATAESWRCALPCLCVCVCICVYVCSVSDLKLFQSLSTALFYFYLYFTTVYALRSRAVIPLAALCIGVTLAVLCNHAYPFDSKAAGSANTPKAGDGGGSGGGATATEDGVDGEIGAHVVKRSKAAGRVRAV